MRHLMVPCLFCDEGRGMYGVELYAAVRLAVVDEGSEPPRGGAAVRHRPPDCEEDAELLRRRRAIGGRSRYGGRSWTGSPASSTRSWRRTRIRTCRASSGTRRIGFSSVCGTSTGFPAATRSRPCENSGGDGDGGLGNHDLRRSHVIWRFGAGSPVEGAPGLRRSMCGARFWLDSRLMPSRRRSRREHLPARSRGGCCKPAP